MYSVTDLCDEFGDKLQVAEPMFSDFGGKLSFGGPISTVKCFEDNSLLRTALAEAGEGRVLVVDGGGSDRCALLGDNLAQLAVDNGWAGVVVYGCIRDSAAISEAAIAVKALNTHPKKSLKKNVGDRDVPVHFAGLSFYPQHWVYGDLDGLVVANSELTL